MAIERYREQPSQYMGMVAFDPAAPSGLDLSGMREQIRAQRMQLAEEREQKAGAAALRAGAQAQLDTEEGRAPAPEDFAARFREQFTQGARKVHEAQAHLDSVRTVTDLTRQHRQDPEGFAQAWDAYQRGQVETVAETDPERAIALELELNEVGLTQQIKIEEAKLAQEQAEQLAAAGRTAQETRAVLADYLLETGDEETYFQGLEDLQGHYAGMVDAGLMSPEQADAALDGDRVALAEEFVRGNFGLALEEGDIGGAQGIIMALEEGRWFENNRKARQLAGQLMQTLKARSETDVPSGGVLVKQLRQVENAIRQGEEVPDEVLTSLVDRVNMVGTDDQRFTALNLYNSAILNRELRPRVEQATFGELEQLREELSQHHTNLPPDRFNELLGMVEGRQEEILEALDAGDITRLGGQQNWRSMSAEEVREQQTRAARVAGLPTSALPVWNQDALQSMAQAFERAGEEGDLETATEVLTKYFAPAGENRWRQVEMAMRAGNRSGEFGVAAMYGALGMPADGVQLQRLAAAGRQTGAGGVPDVDPSHMQDFLGRSEVEGAVAALAMGRPEMIASANSMLQSAYLGAAQEARARGETGRSVRTYARDAVERLLQPLGDTTEFANGFRMPSDFLAGHSRGVRAVRNTINEYLDNPERLGLRPHETENAQFYAPVPLGEESIGFMDVRTGRWAQEPGGTEPLLIFPPEVLDQADLNEAPRGWLEGAQDAMDRGTEKVRTYRMARSLARASQATNAPGNVVERIAFAAEATPLRERPGDRFATVGLLPADIENRVDVQAVRRARAQDRAQSTGPGQVVMGREDAHLGSEEMAPYALAEYVRMLDDHYQQSPYYVEGVHDLVAAAYLMGEERMDRLLDEHGYSWKERLPADVQKFLGRMARH